MGTTPWAQFSFSNSTYFSNNIISCWKTRLEILDWFVLSVCEGITRRSIESRRKRSGVREGREETNDPIRLPPMCISILSGASPRGGSWRTPTGTWREKEEERERRDVARWWYDASRWWICPSRDTVERQVDLFLNLCTTLSHDKTGLSAFLKT